MCSPSPANLLLILAGAGTDASVILGFNILTAAQTGNTILFAVALARGDFATGLNSGISIFCFVGGAIAGGWLCRRARALMTRLLFLAVGPPALLWPSVCVVGAFLLLHRETQGKTPPHSSSSPGPFL